jgi:hypothetical protein
VDVGPDRRETPPNGKPITLSDAYIGIGGIGGIPESVPVLILAGSADDRARPDEERDLFRPVAAHGRLIFFEGARHESLLDSDPVLYRESIASLLHNAEKRGQ